MADFILSNKAIEDLSNIWNYTYDVWSESQADKYYQMLIETCQDVADEILSGKIYSDIHEQLFGFHAGRHIIFYTKENKNGIKIVRILHERMDLKNRMNE